MTETLFGQGQEIEEEIQGWLSLLVISVRLLVLHDFLLSF